MIGEDVKGPLRLEGIRLLLETRRMRRPMRLPPILKGKDDTRGRVLGARHPPTVRDRRASDGVGCELLIMVVSRSP